LKFKLKRVCLGSAMQRRGIIVLILGAIVFLASIATGVRSGWAAYQKIPNEVFLLGPGQATINVSQTGTYLVWNDYQMVFQGRSHDDAEVLPGGWQFEITQEATGRTMEVGSTKNITRHINNNKSSCIGSVQITEPGNFTLRATGPDTPRVFSIGYSPFAIAGKVVLPSVVMMVAGVAVAMVIWIWAAVLLSRKN
jgi:hypothetical protein